MIPNKAPITTQTMTVEEFLAFCALPENADRAFELIDGEIAEKEMSDFIASEIAIHIAFLLKLYLQSHQIGRLSGEQGGYRLSGKNFLVPDVGFISRTRMPDKSPGVAPLTPDLAVEVLSPTDRLSAMRRKAARYLEFGTSIVWIVIPAKEQVEVHTAGTIPVMLKRDDTIDGGAVLPGFSCRVGDFFIAD